MTRSVEIPEAAVEASAEKMFWQRWGAGWETASAHERQAWKNQAREVLEAAALPYLAPAARSVVIPRDTCPHGDLTCPCPDGDMCHYEGPNPMSAPAERPVIDRAAARRAIYTALFGSPEGTYDNVEVALDAVTALARSEAEVKAEALREAAPAPAGDGGLREALEKLVEQKESEPDRRPRDKYGPIGRKPDPAIRVSALRDLLDALPAAPAVPQPVDREALAICLHSFDGFAIETGEQWSECNADRKGAFLYQADAVLALLGGSEETPGMKLSRLGIEANARNNGAAVLAGEQEQVER